MIKMRFAFSLGFLIKWLLAGLLSLPCVLFAANTTVNGVSARAELLQSFTAVADDASAVFYNPAGLTQVHGSQIEGGAMLVAPNQKYTNSSNQTTTHSTQKSLAPNLFFSTDFSKPITLGFGIYAPFARSSDYTVNAATSNLPHFSNIVRIDFSPTVAFQPNRYISFGLGLVASRITKRSSIAGIYQRGRGYGFTGQAGLMVYLPHHIKLGASYLGKERARLTGFGDASFASKDGFLLYLKFPAIVRVGLAWQANPNLLLSLGYDNELWAYFNEASHRYDNPTLNSLATANVDGKAAANYRAGLLYKPWEHGELLFGYTYSRAAVPTANIAPAQADYNVHYVSLGYSHYINHWRFDLGYEDAQMPKRSSGKSPLFPGSYSAHANIFVLGAAYNFDAPFSNNKNSL